MATETIQNKSNIFGGTLGSGAKIRTFTFSGTAKGLLIVNSNIQSRCGLYILYGSTGTPYYGTVLASDSISITSSNRTLVIQTTANVGLGIIWYDGMENVSISE